MKPKFRFSPLLLFAFLGVILLLSIENFLIFYPERYPSGNWSPAGFTPEDAWIETEDGIKLHGWYFKAENQKAVAVYSHGNAGNITGLADYLKILAQKLNISVLAYDYRGYGRSNGSPNVKGIILDGKAATKWLAEKEGITPADIVQIGRSLGGGVALQTANEIGTRGLILENTFTSLATLGKKFYPWLPVKLIMRQDLDSLKAIKVFGKPLLVIHGERDELIPFSMGQELYDAASEPKQFLRITNGRHNDFPPPYYFIEMDRFIGRL